MTQNVVGRSLATTAPAGNSAQRRPQAIENGQGVRRTAGNEQIDRQQSRGAIVDFRVMDVWPAGNRTCSYRDNQFWPRDGLERLLECNRRMFSGTGPVINNPSA